MRNQHLSRGRLAALVGFMWGAYLLNYGDRQAIFAMFGALRADLQMSDRELGLTGSLFLWVYGIGCPLAGRLADRYPKKRLVVLSLVVWSIVTLATGMVQSALMLLALRAAMGISEALYMPAAIALTANATPAASRSRALSILTTGQIVGTVAGSWFGGFMAERGQWRAAFVCLGCLGLLYAVPYFRFLQTLDEEPRAGDEPLQPDGGSPGRLSRVPTFCMLCLVFPIFVFGLWMLYSWLPSFIGEKFALDKARAGFEGSFYLQVGSLAGLFLGGQLADLGTRWSRAGRLWLLVASLACAAPFLHLTGSSATLPAARASMAGFGLFGGFLMGNIFPAAFDVVPPELRASAVGALNFFGAIVSGFAPLVVGQWKQSIGIERMLSAVGLAYLAGAVLLMFTIRVFFPADWAHLHRGLSGPTTLRPTA